MEDNNELELPAYVELHATRNNPDSVLNTIDTFSVKETRLKWMMNISVPKGFVLDEQVHRALSKAPVDPNRGHVFVEMGCYIGYSTVRSFLMTFKMVFLGLGHVISAYLK